MDAPSTLARVGSAETQRTRRRTRVLGLRVRTASKVIRIDTEPRGIAHAPCVLCKTAAAQGNLLIQMREGRELVVNHRRQVCGSCARDLHDDLVDADVCPRAPARALGVLTRRAIASCVDVWGVVGPSFEASECSWCMKTRVPAGAFRGVLDDPVKSTTSAFVLCGVCRPTVESLRATILCQETTAAFVRALLVRGLGLVEDVTRVIWQVQWAAVDHEEALMNCPEVLGVPVSPTRP